jgi:hypothetical protein
MFPVEMIRKLENNLDDLIAPVEPRQVADGIVNRDKRVWSRPVGRSNWPNGRSTYWKFNLQSTGLWEVVGWLRHVR